MSDTTTGPGPKPPTPMSLILAALFLTAGTALFLALAPGTYQVLKALHVIAIVIWVGGDVTLTTLGIVFERKRDGVALAELGKMGTWIGTRVYTPALFAVFFLGVALIEKGDFSWTTPWLLLSLVGWGIASCVGVGFVGPELGRIEKAAAAHGPDSAEVGRRVKRLFTIFRFDTSVLILTTILMVAKPDLW